VVITALPENAAADVERVARMARLRHHPPPDAGRARQGVRRRQPPAAPAGLRAGRRHRQKPHADLLFQYAASGFRDFTRIAGSSPRCGATSAWPTKRPC
jgi:prephenate dehydrogenase